MSSAGSNYFSSNKLLLFILIFAYTIIISTPSPAATHFHNSRGSSERETDGAFSPRDKKHLTSGEHHSEFDHEAILGSHKTAEEFDHLSPEESQRRLAILLKKMDLNKDGTINKLELKSWILRSFRMLSEEESSDRFEDSDVNENGLVTWDEYLADTFSVSVNEIMANDADQQLVRDDKKMFDLADKNKDGSLDKREFLLFSHPEEHPEMLPLILEQTLQDKDSNKDGYIDFQEYMGDRGKDEDKEWLLSEKAKFDNDYDKDHDGRLNTGEILGWMVPSNDDIAEEEAEHLLNECDVNDDGSLSFQEALDQHDVFVGSEATDYGDHLHNIHAFQDEL